MKRRHYTSEEKVTVLKEHFEKNISIPDLCEKYRIHPNQFYKWKKALFEGAVEYFSLKSKSGQREKNQITKLESRLKDRNEVIVELLEENLSLKKSFGEI